MHMSTDTSDPDPILIGEEDIETEPDRLECHIKGCERPGDVVEKISAPDENEDTYDHYVCRFHHRVLLGTKIFIGLSAVVVFLWAVYASA